ncbi:anaerobic ribonucleoside-triphosphate reductase activating protein [Desulfonatronum thiosulfatophilum]|nr:anaerobic ribonucleoside-triphosphate reductase activating protein [Desulfonatronum thiosulfatophilum]
MQEHGSPWSRLRGLEPMSLCDWPGRVSAVLFLGGCDLRCPTCHNFQLAWETWNTPCLPRSQVMDLLRKRSSWLDGLVVTGGEAALSADLPEWLADLRAHVGLPIKLDTNGMHPAVIERTVTAEAVDLVAVDIKGPWSKYPLLTGNRATPEQARANMKQIFALARDKPGSFQFRTTLVPELTQDDLNAMQHLPPPGFVLQMQRFKTPATVIERR